MDSSRINTWLQVGASVGIILSLLLVALQMEQNSQLLRLQLQQDETNSYIATEFAIAGENYAEVFQKMLEEPENLSLSEMRAIEADIWGHIYNRWLNTYRLYEQGLVDDTEWKSKVDADAYFTFGNVYGRSWWKRFRSSSPVGTGSNELLDYVDSTIQQVPPNYTIEYFREIQRNVSGYQSEQ